MKKIEELVEKYGEKAAIEAKKTIILTTRIGCDAIVEEFDVTRGFMIVHSAPEGMGIRRSCDFAMVANVAHITSKMVNEVDATVLPQMLEAEIEANEKKGA